jgi:translation initiation factor IF-3
MTRPVTPKQRINHFIKNPEVRVIGAEGEQLGILKTSEALRLRDPGAVRWGEPGGVLCARSATR